MGDTQEKCGTKREKGGEALIPEGKTAAPGAIPTRDLPLRSRIHEPFVFNSYEKA